MSDEQPTDAVPVDANPAPAPNDEQQPTGEDTVFGLPAHNTDENPEEHMGRVTKDPWADAKQKDWPDADKIDLEDNA